MGFQLDTKNVSEKSKEKALKELRETPENVENGLKKLRELIENEEKQKLNFDTSDDFLTIFLRPCHWYPESAYELMKRVAKFKEDHKNLFANLKPEDLQAPFCEGGVVNILKDRDQEGRRVLVVKCGSNWNPKQVTTDHLSQIVYLMHQVAILEPETQINGIVIIMDYDGMGMTQVTQFTPSFCMQLMTFIQEAIPLRIKAVHIVNQPFVFNMVWTILKPLLTKKLKERTHFHGNKMASLHKHMNKEVLPADYGGDLPKIDYSGADWYPIANDYIDHIERWGTYGYKK